jgi:hypothetical protein
VEKLCVDIDNEVDSDLPGRDDLARISEVLKVIKGKIKPTQGGGGGGGDGAAAKEEQQLLPQSKREELVNLLPSIEHTLAFQLQQRKEKATREQGPRPAGGQRRPRALAGQCSSAAAAADGGGGSQLKIN